MDETVTVPIYAIAFVVGVVAPWMIWLTNKSNSNSQAIAVINANHSSIAQDLKSLSDRIDDRLEKIENRFDVRLEKLENRFEKVEDKIEKIYTELLRRK